MSSDALTTCTALREEAQTVIDESKILGTLSAFGEVDLVGSYVSKLMVWPDIDIHIYSPEANDDTAFEVARTIYNNEYFGRVEVVSDSAVKTALLPDDSSSWYIRTKKRTNDNKWNFDIWLFSKDRKRFLANHEELGYLFDWSNHLSDDQKTLILESKLKLIELGEYHPGTSVKIYKAVNEHKIDTVDGVISEVSLKN